MFAKPFLFLLASASASLSIFNQDCVNTYTASVPNDMLVGTWYRIYQWTLFGLEMPTVICSIWTFTRPTAAELQAYREENEKAGHPYVIDDNSLLVNFDDYFNGMISGNNAAKFYVIEPNNSPHGLSFDEYLVHIYDVINENYILNWSCNAGIVQPWLMSKNRNPPADELNAILASLTDLNRMIGRRFCSPS